MSGITTVNFGLDFVGRLDYKCNYIQNITTNEIKCNFTHEILLYEISKIIFIKLFKINFMFYLCAF